MGAAAGHTLFRYLALVFVRWIAGFFLLGAAIILLADFVEFVRRAIDKDDFSALGAVVTSLLKTPSLAEDFIPFAVLFGAMGAFVALNRHMELVVMRASGMSAWQFIFPGVVVAVLAGLLASTVYNPLSAIARERSDRMAAEVLGQQESLMLLSSRDIWFRQEGPSGSSIMNAASAAAGGLRLFQVVAYRFGPDENFIERIHAERGDLSDGAWQLRNAVVFDASGRRSAADLVTLDTYLSPIEVQETIAQPAAISFWQLPGVAELAERAGLPSHRFEMQYQQLLARPLLLAAMVVVAATVSLRLMRLGGVARTIGAGVGAGFVLYLASEVAGDLGRAGVVAPMIAAWTPGIAAGLIGVSRLLRTEDG